MWDQRYASEDFFYGTEPNDFLVAEIERFAPGDRILSLAEGEGRNAVFMASRGLRVTAVDSSGVGLAKAARLAEQHGVHIETIQADLEDWSIEPGRWNGIVSIFCHLLQPARSRLHAQVAAGLRPGGWFLYEAYTPRQLELATGGPPTVERLVERDVVVGELQGLDLLRAEEVRREIHEGRGHDGPSAVLQIVGRRA